MPETKLTKRQYLGEGFFHHFRNDETGELVSVECTREEYHALGKVNAGPAILKGHTWLHSDGGTTRVDTENGFLGDNEYTEKPDYVVVRLDGSEVNLPKGTVTEDGELQVVMKSPN